MTVSAPVHRPIVAIACLLAACTATSTPGPTAAPGSPAPTPPASLAASTSPAPTRIVHDDGIAPVEAGEPIDLDDLAGRIVTDNFEDVFAMDPDGSNVVMLAAEPGSEFDADWSPDGRSVVYRDSTRGINNDDEIFVVRADGTRARNLTNHPANDWGPAWSPDGSTIVFNSDRDGGLRGYFVDPGGSNLRPVGVESWFEYPAWSPDGTRIVFEGAVGPSYEIFVLDVATGDVRQLTDARATTRGPSGRPTAR